jgi:hypothetical protein
VSSLPYDFVVADMKTGQLHYILAFRESVSLFLAINKKIYNEEGPTENKTCGVHISQGTE